MDYYKNLTLLQLKNLKHKEKDPNKVKYILNAITNIIKNSQSKWQPENLFINKEKNDDSSLDDITISTLTETSDDNDTDKNNKKPEFTNYDISKYYNKVSNKKDDNDRIYTRMMNFADYLENKPNNNIDNNKQVIKPYLDNKKDKKELGKRKYI